MGNNRKGWYERLEVSRITKDWVEMNCRLTDREIELLKIINNRKLVRRDHLEIISPSFRAITENRTEIINRSLRKMYRSMCVDKIHEKRKIGEGGNNPLIFSTDKAGAVILGCKFKRRIIHRNENSNIRRILPLNYRHINGVNLTEVKTIRFCEEYNTKINEWVLENAQELHYGQEDITLIPDVYARIKSHTSDSRALHMFIEYDTGSENMRYREPPIIRDKIIKYKKFKNSNIWINDYPYFPFLIFITEDGDRVEFINKKCKENGVAGFGVYYENYEKFLKHLYDFV